MFWMHADPLRGQVGEGWALEIETLGECHLGPKKSRWKLEWGEGWEYIKKIVTPLLN
jgi:hypothetical protein